MKTKITFIGDTYEDSEALALIANHKHVFRALSQLDDFRNEIQKFFKYGKGSHIEPRIAPLFDKLSEEELEKLSDYFWDILQPLKDLEII